MNSAITEITFAKLSRRLKAAIPPLSLYLVVGPGPTPEGGAWKFPTKHRAEAKSEPMPCGEEIAIPRMQYPPP
jgi:hypothetical protein